MRFFTCCYFFHPLGGSPHHVAKGQLILKCLFGVSNERKQYDLKYHSSLFFCSFFWENWRYQKYVLKLTDLYSPVNASDIDLPVLFLIIMFLIKQFSLAFLLLGFYAVGEIAARLASGLFWCWDSAAGLFSSWTNEQASLFNTDHGV